MWLPLYWDIANQEMGSHSEGDPRRLIGSCRIPAHLLYELILSSKMTLERERDFQMRVFS